MAGSLRILHIKLQVFFKKLQSQISSGHKVSFHVFLIDNNWATICQSSVSIESGKKEQAIAFVSEDKKPML